MRTIERLDGAPARLTRPMALVRERGYATTWLYVRVQDEGPAATRIERRLYVIRDDGRVFGDDANGMDELGVAVSRQLAAPEERLWSRRGVDAYARGDRPDAANVFLRLCRCYDAFIDFGRSLATPRTMCELWACLSVATWLGDAFALVPYVWITGERGSGKTQLGTVWAETSYLGEIVLGSTSYAALRDLSEAGAALYFDDAEQFGSGRRGEAIKRELLLAGNRRGARVAVKARGGGDWETRWVSAYTPRAFSSISLPDATLGSRAIVVPLARTADGRRALRDPGDPAAWPCDTGALRDDLWALGLWWQGDAAQSWQGQEADAGLVGREHEKWRPLLVVAALMEAKGVDGLVRRLREVMIEYQAERVGLVGEDETTEVVRGLVWCAATITRGMAVAGVLLDKEITFTTEMVWTGVEESAPTGRLSGLSRHAATTRVGLAMGRLRFRSARGPKPGRERGWAVTLRQIAEVANAYGVDTSQM